MAERLDLIIELGQLAKDATLRGDDLAAATLRDAAKLLLEDVEIDNALASRRGSDAVRQRRRRERIAESHGSHVTSREERDGSQGFPRPLPNSPSNTATTTRLSIVESELDDLTALTCRQVRDKIGVHFSDVEDFLARRDSSTWHSWLKEMLVAMNAYTADDVASVCRDDGALERRIGSPGGFRVFVRKAAEERVGLGRREAPSASRSPSRRAASGGTPAPVSNPAQEIKW